MCLNVAAEYEHWLDIRRRGRESSARIGDWLEESVRMNPRFHDTAMKMSVGDETRWRTGFVPVALSGLDVVWFLTRGSAFGSTPGYIPAAASRL